METIRYAFGDSSLGPFLAAESARGLAFVAFDSGVADLEMRFPETNLVQDQAGLHETIGKLAVVVDHPERDAGLTLDLRGSDFECRVWNALRAVPAGTTTTYGEVAASLGAPRQAKEVGEACAANTLAVVVPCHRIVRKDGSIAGYRWGVRRKRLLLAREHSARLLQPAVILPNERTAI